MTDLMNTSTHYPNNPNEVVGNRRPARPSSAQQRSTTPTRNRPQNNTNSNGLNTTAKLEQSLLRHELDRTTASNHSQKLNGKGKNRLYSTWTPLQDDETNARLFDERRQLVTKWFEKWTDDQRRLMLDDLMSQSRPRQLTYTRNLLTKKFPAQHQDFTRSFPRVLCLYIFSFLDPRSLCRSAQVCWYWKFLSECDQIWMPKCLRFGWTPKQSPSPYESNVWKRVYTFNIQALQTMPVRMNVFVPLTIFDTDFKKVISSNENLTMVDTYVQTISTGDCFRRQSDYSHRSQSGYYDDQLSSRQNTARSNSARHPHNQSHVSLSSHRRMEQPPWRANSRAPTDTLRYNYLDNDDTVLETLIAKHRKYGTSILQHTESDHELKSPNKERQTRSRTDERSEHNGRKRRSQSLSARGSPSVSFRDEHTSGNSHRQHNHSFLARPPSASGVNRPVDIPRPPSSAQKLKYTSKTSNNEISNRTWHATNNDDYNDE